jgi:hypothetical protein
MVGNCATMSKEVRQYPILLGTQREKQYIDKQIRVIKQ